MARQLERQASPDLTVIFSKALPQHVASLCPVLREADRQEILALTGAPPEVSLPSAVAVSESAQAAFVEGSGIAAIFGVEPVLGFPDVGIVWFVGSDLVTRHTREFLTLSRQWLDATHLRYPLLTNRVDARNELHIRWLRWMGFSLLQKIEPWGAQGRPFIEFAKLKCV